MGIQSWKLIMNLFKLKQSASSKDLYLRMTNDEDEK